LGKLFAWLDSELQGKDYQIGEDFTVADGYLFTTLTWTSYVGLDISALARLAAFRERVAARPAVARAISLEQS
jgi:glutathione S-transferase